MNMKEKDLLAALNCLIAVKHAKAACSETNEALWLVAEKVLFDRKLKPVERALLDDSFAMIQTRLKQKENMFTTIKFPDKVEAIVG